MTASITSVWYAEPGLAIAISRAARAEGRGAMCPKSSLLKRRLSNEDHSLGLREHDAQLRLVRQRQELHWRLHASAILLVSVRCRSEGCVESSPEVSVGNRWHKGRKMATVSKWTVNY